MTDKRKQKTKDNLLSKLSPEQLERVELMLEADKRLINSGDAYKCGVRCDPVYMNYHRLIIAIRSTVEDVLGLCYSIDDDKRMLLSESYPDGKSKRDVDLSIRLKHTNIMINVRKLWEQIAGLYQCVDMERIDRKIFFKREDYEKFVNEIKETLCKAGIDLYKSPL